MKQIINKMNSSSSGAEKNSVGTHSTSMVCNYQNNYYGDQLCVALKSIKR